MRLIDADALELEYVRKNGAICLEMIGNQPTIDAEPVVRCNICKRYETDVGFCNYHGHGMHWDDFCSRGAKMDLEV